MLLVLVLVYETSSILELIRRLRRDNPIFHICQIFKNNAFVINSPFIPRSKYSVCSSLFIDTTMATRTPLSHRVQKYFFPELNDLYKCTLCQTNKSVSGEKKSNLVSHIRNCHPEKLENSNERKSELQKKRLKVIQSMAEIVTVNGRPFNSLLDSGLIHLLEKDLEDLDSAGFGITLNKNLTEIKDYVKHLSLEIQKILSLEVKNRSLSILLDIGSRNGLSILGIGLQFMKDDIVQNKAIGMIPLHKSHTAAYIVEELKKCLQLYDIEINQVIAMVSDNASNMLAATKRLDKFIIEQNSNGEVIADEPDFNRGLGHQEILSSIMEMHELDSILSDDENFEQLFVEVIGELSKHTTSIITIRCGAHSIQLAVRDALKKAISTRLLSLANMW